MNDRRPAPRPPRRRDRSQPVDDGVVLTELLANLAGLLLSGGFVAGVVYATIRTVTG